MLTIADLNTLEAVAVAESFFFFFLIGKENHILKRAEPQTGTPREYTRSIQRARILHKRKAKTKKTTNPPHKLHRTQHSS